MHWSSECLEATLLLFLLWLRDILTVGQGDKFSNLARKYMFLKAWVSKVDDLIFKEITKWQKLS